ncbi:MAG TPA: URC4/urg3 family protein [Bdellovibrionota bacterium]|nr:URC4/urg3 family protein [Bdellovibrionota bacterium]
MTDPAAQITHLLSTRTVRAQANRMLERALEGGTAFEVRMEKLDDVARLVADVTRDNYPDLRIPYHSRWGHFRAGGIDRGLELARRLEGLDPIEKARVQFELVIPSVLLDAGAGMKWRYKERESGREYARSEGLAVASYRLFQEGAFSSDRRNPLRCDSAGLLALSRRRLEEAFQVSGDNPLVGVEGRLHLMHALGRAIRQDGPYFQGPAEEHEPGVDSPHGHSIHRLGTIVDYLFSKAVPPAHKGSKRTLAATTILDAVQRGLGSIWPGRESVGEFNLGDVWRYEPFEREIAAENLEEEDRRMQALVPFHKLSQWLSYSLMEPLEAAGLEITALGDLTGLPEYRNGGLFLDGGVLALRDPADALKSHAPGSELVVEWRALTVALLDRVAPPVRKLLQKTDENYPLAKVLEGGTWWAGRKLAAKARPDGGSPLRIESDGTVF